MLVIKIEIWPHGDHGLARTIGWGEIANVGGNDLRADYSFKFAVLKDNASGYIHSEGKLRDFDRGQNAWDLLQTALNKGEDDGKQKTTESTPSTRRGRQKPARGTVGQPGGR